MAAIDPTGHWCLVPDLGLDKVFVYAMYRPDIGRQCAISVNSNLSAGDRLIQEMIEYILGQHRMGATISLVDALYDTHGGGVELSVPDATSVEQLIRDSRVVAAWKAACKVCERTPQLTLRGGGAGGWSTPEDPSRRW